MNVAGVRTAAPGVGGAAADGGISADGAAVASRCSTGGSGLGGSGIGSATSASSSIGLVYSLGGGVGALSLSGGPGGRSPGGVEGAAGASGSSSMTTGAPASKSDASVDGSRVSAAMLWAATTTTKQAIQRAVSARSIRNSWSATLMGSLRCRCGGRITLDEIAADHGQDLDAGIGIERTILR